MNRLVQALGALASALAIALAFVPAAHAETAAIGYDAFVKIAPDGSLTVKAELSFPTGNSGAVTQTFNTARRLPGDYEQRYQISEIKADGGTLDTRQERNLTTVTITPTGPKATLSYRLTGASRTLPDGTVEVSWPLLQGLSVPVATFDAIVIPGAVFQFIDCAAGAPSAPGGCSYYTGGTEADQFPKFHDADRAPGEIVQFTIRYPKGNLATNAEINELWTLGRAFSFTPVPLGIAFGLLLLGAALFYVLHRKYGTDAHTQASPTLVAEFRPVGPGESEFIVRHEIRPGQVGTVLDERVDPPDVIATLLDLAVRGHLVIEELPRDGVYTLPEWTLTRVESADPVAGYEETLLTAIGGPGSSVALSDLGAQVAPIVAQVQDDLYRDVTERGWFRGRPDVTRSRWLMGSLIGVLLATLALLALAAWTHYGLVGLVLVILAVGMMFVAQAMPARTESGASLVNGLAVLRGQLLTAPTEQLPKGRELEQLSRVLPYAVVLGGVDRWLAAIVAADGDADPDPEDLGWYRAPADWQLSDFPHSLTNFIVTLQGRFYSR